MAEKIFLHVNGQSLAVAVDDADTPLLYVLRDELKLNNPHFGCGLAQCGACMVLVNGTPTRSCVLPIGALRDRAYRMGFRLVGAGVLVMFLLYIAGNIVPGHVPMSVIAGVATPVSATNPLPVQVAEGAVSIDGSTTIVLQTTPQTLFAGVTPTLGYQIGNNTVAIIWVRDTGSPAGDHAGMPVPVGGTYTTPLNYRPSGPVSIYGGITGSNVEARRW